MAADQRVAAINQRFQQQGDSVINLPLTFEAELFEFKEVVNLSYYARFRNVDQVNKEVTQAMNANLQTSVTTVNGDTQQLLQLDEQMRACGRMKLVWEMWSNSSIRLVIRCACTPSKGSTLCTRQPTNSGKPNGMTSALLPPISTPLPIPS